MGVEHGLSRDKIRGGLENYAILTRVKFVVYSDYKVRLGYTLGKGGSNGKARQKNNNKDNRSLHAFKCVCVFLRTCMLLLAKEPFL